MSGSSFSEKSVGYSTRSAPREVDGACGAHLMMHCGLSVVASRASRWPEIPSGMIDLLCHDGDLDVFFED